jgi:uncharacterized protein (DUF736 family)
MKNKMSGLLMEVGAEYNKQRLHGKEYFQPELCAPRAFRTLAALG